MDARGQPLSATQTRHILLTDIHGSSRLSEQYPNEYSSALDAHNAAVEHAVSGLGGEVYKNMGDGYIALFDSAAECLSCAVQLQCKFATVPAFADDEAFQVRIAAHGGSLRHAGDEYYGPALNRAARICQACHPGQVLASAAVASHLAGDLPDGAALHNLGLHELRDLAGPEQLYQLDHPDFARHEFPPLLTLGSRPNNLVRQPNEFIGRHRELKELSALLLNSRHLVTITAPGGYGKSRLAAQLCADLLTSFERGVFYVELAPVREASDIAAALAAATGFQFFGQRNPQQQLVDFLREKEMLLCFDNFEHVLTGAPFVAEILREAPQVKLIVTSREPLRIAGEQQYPLDPLRAEADIQTPDEFADAELLFADRASLVVPDFALGEDSYPSVQEICRKLNGIPLAIELAAAWVDSFSLSELAAELDRQLELTARLGDTAERHRSLRASLDWSWNLISKERQRILMQLATFRGGCFVEAAEALVGIKGLALRRELAALVDKSWLYTREIEGQKRFFLRDAASREYAFEKLAATRADGADSLYEQAAMAHARYFSALMEREGAKLHAAGQLGALKRIGEEKQNVYETMDTLQNRLADESAAAEAAALLLPMLRPLSDYLQARSEYSELVERFQPLCRIAEKSGNQQKALLWSLLCYGDGLRELGEYDTALDELNKAEPLANSLGDPHAIAVANVCLGKLHSDLENWDLARELFAQALTTSQEIADRHGIGLALVGLGNTENRQGNYERSREVFSQALALMRGVGDRRLISNALNGLGVIEDLQGNYDAARELFNESLSIRRELDYPSGIAGSLNNLGLVAEYQGDFAESLDYLNQSLAIKREIGDRPGVASTLSNLASLETKLGRLELARSLLEESLAINRAIGSIRSTAGALSNLGIVEANQGNLDAARTLLDQALEINLQTGNRDWAAVNHERLGNVEHLLGNYQEAHAQYSAALALRRELDDRAGIVYALTNLGNVANTEGNLVLAREFLMEALATERQISSSALLFFVLQGTGWLLAALARLPAAAICLYGAIRQMTDLGIALEPALHAGLEQALSIIEHPETGLPAEERIRLKAQAEAMSPDELGEFAQAELDKL